MSTTMNVQGEVQTTVSYETVMVAALALINQAERYAKAGMTKEYTLESLNDIARALIELEWNTKEVRRLIDEVNQREF